MALKLAGRAGAEERGYMYSGKMSYIKQAGIYGRGTFSEFCTYGGDH